jgi:hypothetical protein
MASGSEKGAKGTKLKAARQHPVARRNGIRRWIRRFSTKLWEQQI